MKIAFDISKLKRKLSQISDWLKDHHLPPNFLLIVMGIISTGWFLIRVIPKPSRAAYPCMRVAAPLMSGFVVYLITLGGIAVIIRKARRNFLRARYIAAGSMLFVALVALVIIISQDSLNSYANSLEISGISRSNF